MRRLTIRRHGHRGRAREPRRRAMSDRTVIEWAPFRLAEGVTEERLTAASRTLQREFLVKQRGFLHRELLRGRDGGWVDLIHWADASAAEDAMKAASESATCLAYFQLLAGLDANDPANGVLHFDRVESYTAEGTTQPRPRRS